MAKGKTQWKYFNGLFLAWGLSAETLERVGSLLICPENIIITHDTPRSASELIGSATNVNRNTREGPGKDLERSLNRQYSHDSLFLLRGRMNHVTLLLELLGTDSSSSCLQGGTREPSSTDVLLSLLTSAR